MRIHTANAETFIQALAVSIHKDPSSLRDWRCLHIKGDSDTPFGWSEAVLNQLKEMHTDMDCDIIHCADNDVFLITRSVQTEQLYTIAQEFTIASPPDDDKANEITLYDLFRDNLSFKGLLSTKATEQKTPPARAFFSAFGEVSSLHGVFLEAKKLRKARLPLHVMIVEDDPLTRRLVTSSLKKDYALITAATAQEAVANYLLHAPDIVFLDIGLPDASGFDVLHQIMTTDKDAFVVMFSSNSYLDNITTALSHGASGFVAKPFRKENMQQYIQSSATHHRKDHA